MKHEIGVEKRPYMKEAWPGQYGIFSWLEYAITMPYPTYLITTLKENGKPNACWHSWGCFSGEGQGYYSLLVVSRGGHTCDNILRTGEWCINMPTLAQRERCGKTIEYNSIENDEIADAGFTAEPSQVIQSPRIAECPVSIECTLQWHKPLFEGSRQIVCVGKVVHLAMAEDVCVADPGKRLERLSTMYNMRSTLNPLTGETGPAMQPIIRLPDPG
jgi:flavin reductase (DIM6/NTAB) family NADH-FMN oxidoreductase RutF